MNEREDVEALADAVFEIVETTPRFKAKAHVEIELTDWLAVHDERVRADERKRLAEERKRREPTDEQWAAYAAAEAERLAGDVAAP